MGNKMNDKMKITIEILNTGIEENILRKGVWEDDSLFGSMIRNALKNFKKEQEWIPVKTGKLPKNYTSCWITVVSGKKLVVVPATYIEGSWFTPNSPFSLNPKTVVAWMKLQIPKPYKEEGEEADAGSN